MFLPEGKYRIPRKQALHVLTGFVSYFPTVYEPTVFENYVHGMSSLKPNNFCIYLILGQISLSTMYISNFRSGTQQARKSSIDYGPFHMVSRGVASVANFSINLTHVAADDTDLIMLCYSVDSKDSLENVESKWVGEIADNCPGVKLVLVALKCDLREQETEEEGAEGESQTPAQVDQPREKRPTINYDQGLEVARRINAARYLECSAMRNRGVNEAFTEAARVALSVKKDNEDSKCTVM